MKSKTAAARLAVGLFLIGLFVVLVAACSPISVTVITPVPAQTPTASPFLTVPLIQPTTIATPRTGGTAVPVATQAATASPTRAPAASPTASAVPPLSPATAPGPIKAKQRLGELTVKLPEGCWSSLDIKASGKPIATASSDTSTQMAVGTYEIVIWDILGRTPGGPALTETVAIREKEKTVVDLTGKLGRLLVTRYSEMEKKASLPYQLFLGGQAAGEGFVGSPKCGVPGAYTLKFTPRREKRMFGPTETFGVLKDLPELAVAIKAGDQTIVGPEAWPGEFGLLSFGARTGQVTFQVYDFPTGKHIGYGLTWGSSLENLYSGPFWMSVGVYRVEVTKPYIGLVYEPVEIRAGEETVLQLPD